MNDYEFRGKCKELATAAADADSSLTLVRGYYHCPFDGKQAHWWCKKSDGTIVDPSARQFKDGGTAGGYEEFSGFFECEQCGGLIEESEIRFAIGRRVFCSYNCYGKYIL